MAKKKAALAPVTGSADGGPQSSLLLALLEIQARALRHYSGSYKAEDEKDRNLHLQAAGSYASAAELITDALKTPLPNAKLRDAAFITPTNTDHAQES